MKCVYITSMNKKYYDHCGKLMIDSFEHAYKKTKLHVYNEDDFYIDSKKVELLGWDLGLDYIYFKRRWEDKNLRVTTFAKKAFSIIHAMNTIDCDRLIWLDADTIIDRPIHSMLIELISPDDVLSTHFGVKHKHDNQTYFSCETGFFILNKQHQQFEEFRQKYTDIYKKDKHHDLRRFYDGEVYGKTVEVLEQKGAKMMELNPGHIHKTPISRSVIAPYLTHYKASLKENLSNDQ